MKTAYLKTQIPSPATKAFLVTTKRPVNGFSGGIAAYSVLVARLLAGLAILLLIYAKWHASQSPSISILWSTAIGRGAVWLASLTSWRVVSFLTAAVGWVILRRGYTGIVHDSDRDEISCLCTFFTEESLLVLRGLGIQTSSSSATYLSTPSSRFIPTNLIQDIFIHEAFKGFEVRFYLAVVVEGEEEVVVVFPVGDLAESLRHDQPC